MGYWKLGMLSPRIDVVRSFDRVKMPSAEGWIQTKMEILFVLDL
jgi:hypothetical protein